MLIIVHGGAGFKKPSKKSLEQITVALSSGYQLLSDGGSAEEAVIHSIKILEDSGVFNAGTGGNLQADGRIRLDASLMEGKTLKAGSVINLEGIRNPVLAAKLIMESPHVLLTNKGAHRIARKENLPVLPEPDEKKLKKLQRTLKSHKDFFCLYQKYFSTVGAVAFDFYGNLAAGSSTGGVSAMLPGRVGDTPVIGAGIYADNSSGAISCTGIGEYIIRLSLAKEIAMNLNNLSPRRAVILSLKRLVSLGGEAGVIAINRRGGFCITHTTKYMPSGYAATKGILVRDSFEKISGKK